MWIIKTKDGLVGDFGRLDGVELYLSAKGFEKKEGEDNTWQLYPGEKAQRTVTIEFRTSLITPADMWQPIGLPPDESFE